MANIENPGALAGATGAKITFQATADGNQILAQGKARRHNSGARYRVSPSAGDAFDIFVKGRNRWALEELRKAGGKGCTPIDNPAPRWSAYVHNLRELGLNIDTITEPHGGDYAGHHGRYVLRDIVTPVWEGGAA